MVLYYMAMKAQKELNQQINEAKRMLNTFAQKLTAQVQIFWLDRISSLVYIECLQNLPGDRATRGKRFVLKGVGKFNT